MAAGLLSSNGYAADAATLGIWLDGAEDDDAEPAQDAQSRTHVEVIGLFRRVGRFRLATPEDPPTTAGIAFDLMENDARPCVYVWVEDTRVGGPVVLYLGKAGKGLKVRLGEHRKGFGSSEPGMRHARRIRRLLDRGGEVSIQVHYPPVATIAGERVALHSSVEDHLLSRIEPKPPFNWQGRNSPLLEGLDDAPEIIE